MWTGTQSCSQKGTIAVGETYGSSFHIFLLSTTPPPEAQGWSPAAEPADVLSLFPPIASRLIILLTSHVAMVCFRREASPGCPASRASGPMQRHGRHNEWQAPDP